MYMMLCVYMCQGLCFLYVTQTYTAFAIPSSLSVYTAQSSDIKEKKTLPVMYHGWETLAYFFERTTYHLGFTNIHLVSFQMVIIHY